VTVVGVPRSGWQRVALGALSGLLASLAFPPFEWTFLAYVALVPWLLTLEESVSSERSGVVFGVGWSAGIVYFAMLLWWIVLLDAPALTIPWVRYPGTFAIVAYLGLYFGLFSRAYVWIRRRTSVPGFVVAPVLWTVADLARSYWELGFAWGHLGYSQVPFLPALQVASVAGIHGLTAWIVTINALLVAGIGAPRRAPVLAAAVALFVVPVALGWMRVRNYAPTQTIRVALVQPNVGNDEKWDPDRRDVIFETLADLTRRGAAQGAEMIVWPETAAPCYLLKDREWLPFVEDLARTSGVPLFVGCPDYEIFGTGRDRYVRYSNSAAYFSASGSLEGRMSKIELVPFGERIPFSQYLGFLDRLDFGEADFLPGEGPVVFDVGGRRFGNLVCFEAIFPWLGREYAKRGIDFFVNITNDSWFGAGSGARQHANMALVRCVEAGCGMARAANSGISLGADAVGRTFGETPLFERRLTTVDVPLSGGMTPFTRWGDWVSVASGLATVLLAGFAAFGRGRREKRLSASTVQ
jgi:apolipoprotein N-acyltransferase